LNELSSFDYANDQAAAVTVTEQIPTADDIMTLSRQVLWAVLVGNERKRNNPKTYLLVEC
jgi:hypothetical protein